MIAHLRGTVEKLRPGLVTVDVHGVGYRVSVPLEVWDALTEREEHLLFVTSCIREDAFDLYGFLDRNSRTLFESFIDLQGIGPKLGLELVSVPRGLLAQAVSAGDPAILQSIRGVGKKTAEKLLLDVKNLAEKHPDLFGSIPTDGGKMQNMDQDAIDALRNLGYDTSTVLRALKNLPPDLATTEERVTHALRSL